MHSVTLKNFIPVKFVALLVGLCVVAGAPARAADGVLVTTVTQVLVDDNDYGQCMVRLADSPTTQLGGCAADWLTLDCKGDYSTSKEAARKLDSVNLSLVTGKRLAAYFSDSLKHNGFCYAWRIDTVAN